VISHPIPAPLARPDASPCAANAQAAPHAPCAEVKVIAPRTSFEITASVCKALLLRELLSRLFCTRGAWFWLLAEPLFHVAFLVTIFSAIRVRSVGGIAVGAWIMIGLLTFLAFRRTLTQAMNAVDANRALFTYRQVKPVDTVLVRGLLEGLLMAAVSLLMMAIMALAGFEMLPDDPLALLAAMSLIGLFGLGCGLMACVGVELASGFSKVIGMAMMPLYFLSGVMFPLSAVPEPYRAWLLANPIVHAIELARAGFSDGYTVVPGVSLNYLAACTGAALLMGLALQRRFAKRIQSA